MERWKDYLAEHAIYAMPQEFFECRKFPRERILYIDAEVPMADCGSGGMDAIFFMNYFIMRGFDVVFHGEYTPGCVPKYTEILLHMGMECVYAPQRNIWDFLESRGWTFSWLLRRSVISGRFFCISEQGSRRNIDCSVQADMNSMRKIIRREIAAANTT